MQRYTDFEIWIDVPMVPASAGASPHYPVRVMTSLAGSASGSLELDLADQDFRNELSVVRDMGPDLPARQAFGTRLFEALFRDEVRDAWKISRGRLAAGEADGLRLRLWISDPQLAALPWELLYENGAGFLATAANIALARYLPVPEPPTYTVQDRLRILLVVARPAKLPAIDAQEVSKLEDALASLGTNVEHTVLNNPTPPQIQNALQQGYHVLHFLGHGQAGKLALTREGSSAAAAITDQQFAQLVQGRLMLRLIVLNACSSSQPVDGELFAGMGPALVKMQIPAVVAMQYNSVFVDTASQFSRAFYRALVNGIPVDFAVNEARQQLSAGPLLEHRDWSTPVLYMGTRQGRILVFPEHAASTVDHAWQSLEAAIQVSAQQKEQAESAMAELAQRFREIATRQQALRELRHLAAHLSHVRDAFEPCHSIIRDSASDLNRLIPQFVPLKVLWDQLRQHQWVQLATFVTVHPNVATGSWYQSLQNQVQAIDHDFAATALGALRDDFNAFAGQLRQAEIQVRFQLDGAIDELVRVSDHTLGRFALA